MAVAQNHNLSVNGKSGKTTFNIGLGYLDQDGMNKAAKEDNFKRYNASLNLTTEFNKWITLKAGAIYSKREKSYPYNATGVFDPWYYCYRWSEFIRWAMMKTATNSVARLPNSAKPIPPR